MSGSDFSTRILQKLDPERAHVLAIQALKMGLHPRKSANTYPSLAIKLMGLDFPNPFAIAAGFDKHGEAMTACHKMGLGFAEIGSITPKPQPGNPKPRVFRLKEEAIINRYGFNSQGLDRVERRLATWKKSGILGINLGKNKDTEQALDDYGLGAKRLGPYADYLVVNVSSPNTPGLRGEQSPERLRPLLLGLQDILQQAAGPAKPLVLKVAPDLSSQDIDNISEVVLEAKLGALMVSNTTLSRPQTVKTHVVSGEAGGLSGAPMKELATERLGQFAKNLSGQIPLIGVGGVDGPEAAYAKIRAGASLVQLYTALTYQGAGLISELQAGVAARLKQDGFKRLDQAVGQG